MSRYIQLGISADKAEFSQGLYKKIHLMVTYWKQGNIDDAGNVTYAVMTTEEHLGKLRKFLKDPINIEKHGILWSGLVENNVFVGWPRKKNVDPAAVTTMASSIKAPKKGLLTRIFDRFRFHPKG